MPRLLPAKMRLRIPMPKQARKSPAKRSSGSSSKPQGGSTLKYWPSSATFTRGSSPGKSPRPRPGRLMKLSPAIPAARPACATILAGDCAPRPSTPTRSRWLLSVRLPSLPLRTLRYKPQRPSCSCQQTRICTFQQASSSGQSQKASSSTYQVRTESGKHFGQLAVTVFWHLLHHRLSITEGWHGRTISAC
jgi:hypothetical protein